jgi:hypothetical protein
MKVFKIHCSYFGLSLLLLSGHSSCKKFIEIPPPPTQVVSGTAFSNDNSATSAMIGLYSKMTRTNLNFANGAITLYCGLSADEIYRTSSSSTIDPFTLNEIPSTSTIVKNNFWTAPYSYIYHANAVLEGLSNSKVSDPVKMQLTGEAKLTRAFCYLYLVNLFGDVPLILTTDYRINATEGRTSLNTVYNQIIQDLIDAKNSLKESYPSTGRLRPNKWAAATLLARAYLYRGEWQKAEQEAIGIINSGLYSLATVTSPLSSSNEVIWQIGRDAANTTEGAAFIPSSSTVKPTYAITDSLLKAFETGDERKANWLKSTTVGGQTSYYPFKYKIASSTTVTERLIVLRYAEVLLIRAEARLKQNNTTGALTDLNTIRNRASLPGISSSSSAAEIFDAIQKERQTEFFCEWGHRWLDIKRTGTVNSVLRNLKPYTWQPTDALYPIPFSEIESNTFLTQNPGY